MMTDVAAQTAPPAQAGGKRAALWERSLRAEVATLAPDVRQLVWAWLLRQRSVHTRSAYGRDLSEWLAFCAGRSVDPLAVTVGHGDAYGRWLQEERGLSARSAARKLAAVSSWYAYLVKSRVLAANEFGEANRPEQNRGESRTVGLTESEARALLRAALNDHGRQRTRTAAILALMLSVGPRVAEVVALTLDSLGFERGMRTVRIVGKGGKVRVRQLPEQAAAALDAYLEQRGGEPGPVFLTSAGRPLLTGDVFRLVRRVAREAGLHRPERVTPHTLRHTFAVLAEERGATVSEIQDALGHQSVDTTQIYLQAPRRLENDPSVKVARCLF
jgi:integrase/recombinase XerD